MCILFLLLALRHHHGGTLHRKRKMIYSFWPHGISTVEASGPWGMNVESFYVVTGCEFMTVTFGWASTLR